MGKQPSRLHSQLNILARMEGDTQLLIDILPGLLICNVANSEDEAKALIEVDGRKACGEGIQERTGMTQGNQALADHGEQGFGQAASLTT